MVHLLGRCSQPWRPKLLGPPLPAFAPPRPAPTRRGARAIPRLVIAQVRRESVERLEAAGCGPSGAPGSAACVHRLHPRTTRGDEAQQRSVSPRAPGCVAMENQVLTPHVYWAQRHRELYLRVELSDVQVKAGSGQRDARRAGSPGTHPYPPDPLLLCFGVRRRVCSAPTGSRTRCTLGVQSRVGVGPCRGKFAGPGHDALRAACTFGCCVSQAGPSETAPASSFSVVFGLMEPKASPGGLAVRVWVCGGRWRRGMSSLGEGRSVTEA